jgi:hypothetical protein
MDDAPQEAATKAVDTPAQPTALDMPEMAAPKPAAGMSATSGPLNDDPFGAEPKEEKAAAYEPTPFTPVTATTAQPTPAEK